MHVDADLNGLILGESLLNDAVAIVLVGSIENYSKRSLKMEHLDSNALIFTILSFFTIFIGSVGLGSLIGAATALMTKFTLVKDLPLLETSLFFLMSYRYLSVQSLLDNVPNYLVGCVNSKEISHFLILRLYLLLFAALT